MSRVRPSFAALKRRIFQECRRIVLVSCNRSDAAGSLPACSNSRHFSLYEVFFPFSAKCKSVLGFVVTLLLLEPNPFREMGSQG
jgi:hypothetical protein